MRDERPRDIWDQHDGLLEAVIAGDAVRAEQMARQHVIQAAEVMISRLAGENQDDREAAAVPAG
jgi:DNA-binding GntR family transcriptional regulator